MQKGIDVLTESGVGVEFVVSSAHTATPKRRSGSPRVPRSGGFSCRDLRRWLVSGPSGGRGLLTRTFR